MKNLWPDTVAERDIEWIEPDNSALIDEVVSMGRSMGLEEESEDVLWMNFGKATKLN